MHIEIKYVILLVMKILVLCVGKIKEQFYKDAVAEYQKRLGRYCKLEILEVQDEKAPERAGPAEREQIKEREGMRILSKLREDDYVVALSIQGRMMDSIDFAEHLNELFQSGNQRVVFVIGGSLGLSRAVLLRAREQISFSSMTFPHQLMRVILLEQVYRGCRIIHHQPYHK